MRVSGEGQLHLLGKAFALSQQRLPFVVVVIVLVLLWVNNDNNFIIGMSYIFWY